MKPEWKDAPVWANWLAMDLGGDWYWYEAKPRFDQEFETWDQIGKTRIQKAIQTWEEAENSLEARP